MHIFHWMYGNSRSIIASVAPIKDKSFLRPRYVETIMTLDIYERTKFACWHMLHNKADQSFKEQSSVGFLMNTCFRSQINISRNRRA